MLNEVEKVRLKELEQAFELFNATSIQLTNAYDGLQEQVIHLKGQLAKSDQEKRRVSDQLSRLLNLLPVGVIVLNELGEVVEMNPSAEAVLGLDALGRDWGVVVKNVFLLANNAGELITHDDVVYQLSKACLDEATGKILLIQNVTSARALQEHESRHQRLQSMGEMAASLAHQIRTPLASALLYVSQLRIDKLNEKKREKFVGKALHSLNHLEGLVKDLLQYARGGKGSEQHIDLSELLVQLEKNVETQVACSESQVVFEPVEEKLIVMGDKDALLTALQNLIGNALEVVNQHATIQVYVNQLSEKKVDLVVVDDGLGIEPELLDKIFEPFYTSRAKGTGLGLAVVRAIAEAHGGKAWVKSIVGHGSRFGLRLPLMAIRELE